MNNFIRFDHSFINTDKVNMIRPVDVTYRDNGKKAFKIAFILENGKTIFKVRDFETMEEATNAIRNCLQR